MPPSSLFQVLDGTHKNIYIVPCVFRIQEKDVFIQLWRHVLLYVALNGVDEGVLESHEATRAVLVSQHRPASFCVSYPRVL